MAAKKKAPAKKAAPKKAAAKETSARTREKAEAYRKTGASYAETYMKRGNTGDLAGRGGPIQKVYEGGDTNISIGIPKRGRGRTNQRAKDQFKRAGKNVASKSLKSRISG
jgi:hypothetical protein